ncbi:TRAF3-interacting protein 1 [Eupeodes corollae]|uniref:TRAF3-interacting protein 1 n=1 Tax=Eupeodes corollae TaxID=290404 RepID=UPI0024902C49|nr:TRAF3-interacting protein 1 [Eupeodes corollae]
MSVIDAQVIKRTQDTLGRYVKKPVLSEKLLKKPPFRFLHDVFNTVIRETGYFEGLYTPEELNHETIFDRDAKMKFLQKMIDTIKLITNEPLTVRTSKIVAGHEPEKTNELLQFMGIVIEMKLDWKTAVETVKNEGSSLSTKQKPKDKEVKEKKSTDRSPKVVATKKSESSKEKAGKTEVKDKTKSKDVKDKSLKKPSKSSDVEKGDEKKLKSKVSKEASKKISPKKTNVENTVDSQREPQENTKTKTKSPEKVDTVNEPKNELKKQSESLEGENVINKPVEEQKVSTPPKPPSPSVDGKNHEVNSSKREDLLLSSAAEDVTTGNESRRSSSSKRSSGRSRRSSAEKSRKSKSDDTLVQTPPDHIDALKTVTEEPPTEVPTSPSLKSSISNTNSDVKRESTFVRENSKESTQVPAPTRPRTSLRPPSARPASARPGAPRRRDKNIEIVLQPNDQIKLSGISVKLETFTSELEDDGENLVIIENPNTIEDQLQQSNNIEKNSTQDDSQNQGHLVQQILETQKELVQGSSPDTELTRSKENDISNLNSRQSSARQMNSLRDVIQNLTKSVNPLGKLMDFIPEDIDAMQLELTMWRDTYNQSSIELKKERSLTESVTEPMKNQLVTIEANIKEYREMIDSCRSKILQNAEKIQRLLTTQ